jgi:hypothetical protein
MALDGHAKPQAIVSFNGALLPLAGLAGQFFLPMARLMAAAPFVPQLFAWRAAEKVVLQRLIDGTGSALDAEAWRYARLVASPGHVQGALGMMASWDLAALQRDCKAAGAGESGGRQPGPRRAPGAGRQALALLRSAPGSSLTEWQGWAIWRTKNNRSALPNLCCAGAKVGGVAGRGARHGLSTCACGICRRVSTRGS